MSLSARNRVEDKSEVRGREGKDKKWEERDKTRKHAGKDKLTQYICEQIRVVKFCGNGGPVNRKPLNLSEDHMISIKTIHH